MHCPYCNTVNDDENSFCVSCGKTIVQDLETLSDFVPPTQIYPKDRSGEPESRQTAFPPTNVKNQPPPIFGQSSLYPNVPEQKRRTGLIIGLVAALLIVSGIIGVGGYYIWQQDQQSGAAEVLPDHFGMFVQNKERTNLVEIKQTDVTNAVGQKEELLGDGSLAVWGENASFILFSDAKDVAITDLKLVQLDTVKEDGTMSQIEFQAAPIDGKPTMKKLRVPGGIAKGNYAFVLFNGFLDEGNHKLWAFQVKISNKSDNSDIAKSVAISVKDPAKSAEKDKSKSPEEEAKKQVETSKKDSKAAPPPGSSVAYCNGNDVLLRGSPSLTGKKIGKLSKGQRIYIMYYSENYDEWRGTTANWAFVQTESGGRGWVFTPFVYY